MMVIEGHQERELESWNRTRFEAYILMCTATSSENRSSIFKFLPLPGDPSEEQQQAMEEKAKMDEYKELKKMVDEGSEFVKMMQQAAAMQNKNQ
jgi:hypothetical protein